MFLTFLTVHFRGAGVSRVSGIRSRPVKVPYHPRLVPGININIKASPTDGPYRPRLVSGSDY